VGVEWAFRFHFELLLNFHVYVCVVGGGCEGAARDVQHTLIYSRVAYATVDMAACRACRGCTTSRVVRAMFERAHRRGHEVNLGEKEAVRSLASCQARSWMRRLGCAGRSISPRASRS